ncbi:LrgB family protein [Salinisphaera sp. LB1]|uniref:LrgB family protein n=1 Tax=Salinisphaera sp. LB1 TaxID=2183911 RepID=UPI000D706C2B|nr:LrgB family protein [Salinisphaera sp. LB1]AWN17286.1 LrgA-associated membrane protein LrgB [Salinisphaera sp. LB1]
MSFTRIWVYLAEQPLLWLTLTVGVFWLAKHLYFKARQFPLLNPVLVSVSAIVLLLSATGTPYDEYFQGAQFVNFLLGPATVALAVPLAAQIDTLKRAVLPISIALFVGALTGILSTLAIGWSLGLNGQMLLSLLPRSITTPIAMGVSDQIGGSPQLTAVFVIITGILGAAFGLPLLAALGLRDPVAGGFALGVSSHGIGTARAFEYDQQAGAFSGLAMGLNGALTALLVPLIVWLFGLG